MKFALTYNFTSRRYSVHATTCVACCSTKQKVRMSGAGEFETIGAARAWANAQETEKSDLPGPVEALFTVCKCARKV